MNILITGGTGFVGQRLAKILIGKGHKVSCLVRDVLRAQEVLQGDIRLFEGDLLELPTTLVRSLTGTDVVYHLAGNVFGNRFEELFKINVQGTENLYRVATRCGVRRFIFLSSIAAVGPANGSPLVTEEQTPHPVSIYGESKFRAEEKLIGMYRTGMTELCIVRSPLIYGPCMSTESRLAVLIRRLRDGRFRFIGNGQNTVSICQLNTVVDFLTYILNIKRIQFQIVHIADPIVLTMRELVHLVAGCLNFKTPILNISVPLAYLVAGCLDSLHKMLGVNFYLTIERVRELSGNWGVDIKKARSWHFNPKVEWPGTFFSTLEWLIRQI